MDVGWNCVYSTKEFVCAFELDALFVPIEPEEVFIVGCDEELELSDAETTAGRTVAVFNAALPNDVTGITVEAVELSKLPLSLNTVTNNRKGTRLVALNRDFFRL